MNGSVRPVTGVLAMIEQAKQRGITRVLLPMDNVAEAAWISGMELFGLSYLQELDIQKQGRSNWDHMRISNVPAALKQDHRP